MCIAKEMKSWSGRMQQSIYGESHFDYLVYLPKEYDGTKKYPLVFFLHGAGERGSDLELLKKIAVPKIFERDLDYPGVVVSPQCRIDRTWTSQAEKIYDFLQWIIKKYNIDEDAISITGISMGGFGTWQVLLDHPHVFSAAAPICCGTMSALTYLLTHLPIRIYHGEKDELVDCFYSKDVYKRLKAYGAKDVELFLYPECRHDSWTQAYERTDLLEWLISKRRAKVESLPQERDRAEFLQRLLTKKN